MRDQANRPRLKGLDEMPRRWRTPRQHFFRFRSTILGSKHFSWLWPLLKVALWVLVIWVIVRLLGFPIDKLLHRLFRELRGSV